MLCPICGLQSDTTSVVCSKHISVTYDSKGKIIGWTDVKTNSAADKELREEITFEERASEWARHMGWREPE